MLEDKIYQDYVTALKTRDKARIDFLSFVRAELRNVAIDLKKRKLDDNEVLAVLKKQQKRLEDSKESFIASGRQDLIESLNSELNILVEYLPQVLSDAELVQVVDTVITETNAASMKDMGKVMKEVIARVGVRADSKKVSELVKQKLSAG